MNHFPLTFVGSCSMLLAAAFVLFSTHPINYYFDAEDSTTSKIAVGMIRATKHKTATQENQLQGTSKTQRKSGNDKRTSLEIAVQNTTELKKVELFLNKRRASKPIPLSVTNGIKILEIVSQAPLVESSFYEQEGDTFPPPHVAWIEYSFANKSRIDLRYFANATVEVHSDDGYEQHRNVDKVLDEINEVLATYNVELNCYHHPTVIEHYCKDNKLPWQALELAIGKKLWGLIEECQQIDTKSLENSIDQHDKDKLHTLRLQFGDNEYLYLDIFEEFARAKWEDGEVIWKIGDKKPAIFHLLKNVALKTTRNKSEK